MSGSVIDSISIAVQASGRAIVMLSCRRSDDVLDLTEVYGSCRGKTVDAQWGRRTWKETARDLVGAKRTNEKSSRSSLRC